MRQRRHVHYRFSLIPCFFCTSLTQIRKMPNKQKECIFESNWNWIGIRHCFACCKHFYFSKIVGWGLFVTRFRVIRLWMQMKIAISINAFFQSQSFKVFIRIACHFVNRLLILLSSWPLLKVSSFRAVTSNCTFRDKKSGDFSLHVETFKCLFVNFLSTFKPFEAIDWKGIAHKLSFSW